MTVRVRDRGAEALMRRMRQEATVRVGVIGPKAQAGGAEHGGLTNVEVASFHEFGLGVPQRSFIAGYVDEREQQIKSRIRKAAELIAKGANVQRTLDRFGLLIVGEMQERIVSKPSSWKDLAESTKRRKQKRGGRITALVQTGQLIGSITHEVEVHRRA